MASGVNRQRKRTCFRKAGPEKNLGNVLLSHEVALEVPSALEDFTAVFGMGTGVSPPLLSPRKAVIN